jgi:hypothetical protein
MRRGADFQPTACLRARLIFPALNQGLLLSRDREEAVLFADSAEFCKSSRRVAGDDRLVGRTPRSARVPLDPPSRSQQEADVGVGRGPGGPPHRDA